MYQELYNWVLEIPQTLAQFGTWLTEPIKPGLIDLSPLALLGIGGVSVLIGLIVVHVVKLFV